VLVPHESNTSWVLPPLSDPLSLALFNSTPLVVFASEEKSPLKKFRNDICCLPAC
jgi:hypothetical protein